MIGEVEFRVPDQGGSFDWSEISYPQEQFSTCGMKECKINIKASLLSFGEFQLPEDPDLLSPVFWILAPCKFTKSLTLEIQHCALREDERASSNLSFVSAKCSQRDLAYRFRHVDGGVFTTHSSYGSIHPVGGPGTSATETKSEYYWS